MFKKLMITGCTVLLLTACGTAAPEENAGKTNQPSTLDEARTASKANNVPTAVKDSRQSTQTRPAAIDITNPPISLTEAVNIFKKAHPDVQVESVDLDTDFGRLYYDFDSFDSAKEYETVIDAETGEIIEKGVDMDWNNDGSIDFSAVISPAKAIEIASAQPEAEGLSPTGWSLEAAYGKQMYTIEFDTFSQDLDIIIDAVTGEVWGVDWD